MQNIPRPLLEQTSNELSISSNFHLKFPSKMQQISIFHGLFSHFFSPVSSIPKLCQLEENGKPPQIHNLFNISTFSSFSLFSTERQTLRKQKKYYQTQFWDIKIRKECENFAYDSKCIRNMGEQ
jgi:hypothetical protein